MAMKKLELAGFSADKEAGLLEAVMDRLEKKTKKLSQVFSGIWDGSGAALKNLTAQLEETAQKAVSTGGKLRRSLAGFDQIERLAAPTGGGSSAVDEAQKMLLTLEQLKAAMGGLQEKLLRPLSGWFSSIFPQSLSTAGASILSFLGLTDQGTEATSKFAAAWSNVGGYLSRWIALVPGGSQVTEVFNGVLERMGFSAQGAGGEMDLMAGKGNWLSEALGKVAQAAGLSSQSVRDAWTGSGEWFGENVSVPVEGTLAELWQNMQLQAQESWKSVKEIFGGAGGAVYASLSQAWEGVKETFSSQGVLPEMESGVLSGFRSAANQVIDGINGVISIPFSGLQGILNRLKGFKLGSLQPFKNMNFSIQTPKIPRLAQGAVIPPNREFLAVLGDQHHGTNIEAPLTTIQEAVSIAMEDMIASNMAGHQATVELLREILQAVLGISIGDEVLANAVSRYNTKMAVVRGGVL